MICEHCKEETGIGAPHAYEGKTGVWACPSLPPEEREPWQAIRIVQAENAKLRAEVERLKGPFTCKHPPEYAGGACAACHAEWIDKAQQSDLQIDNLRRLATAARASNGGFVTTIPAWQDLQSALLKLEEKRSVSGPKCASCDQIIDGEPYCGPCYRET